VAALISTLIAKPQNELAGFISNIPIWTWPRSDLNSWTKVLNRFDTTFSDLIDKYDLNKLQLVKFDEADKKLLLELLRFERMLLENSTNRKLFASYVSVWLSKRRLAPARLELLIDAWVCLAIECFACHLGLGCPSRCFATPFATVATIFFPTADPPFAQYIRSKAPGPRNEMAGLA
jgi:hypothetical protein